MKRLPASKVKIGHIRVILLVVGILSIGLGIYREEVKTVLMKAIYICLECIGIG